MIADGRGRAVAFAGSARPSARAAAGAGAAGGAAARRAPLGIVGDRGCGSHGLRERARAMGARPAIPSKSNEAPVACPGCIHANRDRVERLRARLKERRAAATRCAKTAASFLGVPAFAAALDRLRS